MYAEMCLVSDVFHLCVSDTNPMNELEPKTAVRWEDPLTGLDKKHQLRRCTAAETVLKKRSNNFLHALSDILASYRFSKEWTSGRLAVHTSRCCFHFTQSNSHTSGSVLCNYFHAPV